MANSKISALTSATTPLVGTETLPIVQGGVTVKTTVADITNGGGYAGSFTTLGATGNTTLGDASTDTVRVNGYMGVGGAPVGANVAFSITNSALTNPNQFGLYVDYTSSSAATTAAYGAYSRVKTAAAAYTVADVYTFYAADPIKGASSAITNQHGLYIVDQTQGTNNYGITSTVSSGANKWNIYASGTANNYFAGNVVQGTAAKGFDFSANTPLAGKTSTILNWYEEGTFTPNQGAGLTLVGAFSSTGKYTRIGRNVTVGGTVTGATSVAVTAGGVITTSLPFTIGTAGHGNATNAANTASAAVICNTGTTVTSASAIAATGTITFSATYFV